MIQQGDVCWIDLGSIRGSSPAGRRPVLVVQSDLFNRSAIRTTVVVAITSNLQLAAAPGNVRLRKGAAGLPRPSVVNVSQIRTVGKSALGERLGRLSSEQLRAVLDGLRLVFRLEA